MPKSKSAAALLLVLVLQTAATVFLLVQTSDMRALIHSLQIDVARLQALPPARPMQGPSAHPASSRRQDAVFVEMLSRIDKDKDGRVSLQEWHDYGGTDRVFRAWDMDRSGFLEVGELQAMFLNTDPRQIP